MLRGASTRSVGALVEVLCGAGVSASTVSRVTRALDAELRRFHARPIEDRWRFVFLDGVYLPVKKAQGTDTPTFPSCWNSRETPSRT